MSSVIIAGNVSGTVTLDAPSVAGSTVITLPSTSGTMQLTNSALNGSLGATTPSTVVATSVSASSLIARGSTSGTITLAATAVAGSNTITIPASTGTVALTSQVIGVGQTWQDLTASRAASTTYTNSTGKPIFISVILSQDDGRIDLTIDGLLIGRSGTTQGPIYYTLTGIIPAGSTYKVDTTGGALTWCELR